jgi:serine/threonine protein kinase
MIIKLLKDWGMGVTVRSFMFYINLHTNRLSLKEQTCIHNNNCKLLQQSVLSDLKHPNIITLLGFFATKRYNYLLLEYATCGDLFNYNKRYGLLSEQCIQVIAKQLLSGLKYIHSKGYVHCDIKLENILVFLSSEQNNIIIKYTDFGLATKWSQQEKQVIRAGSFYYASPEVIFLRPIYGPEIDVWSLGVVLFCLFYDDFPFFIDEHRVHYSHHQVENNGIIFDGPTRKRQISLSAVSLLRSMLTIGPLGSENRISLNDIEHHPWYLHTNPNGFDDEICCPIHNHINISLKPVTSWCKTS